MSTCIFSELNDTLMQDMASAWPRLRSLVLKGKNSGYTPSVTILGLVPLAQHCPELQTLTILFNGCFLPPSIPVETKNKALIELEVLRSPIEDPEAIAAFLYEMFPRASVKSTWPYEFWEKFNNLRGASVESTGPDKGHWEEVNKLMYAFRVYEKW